MPRLFTTFVEYLDTEAAFRVSCNCGDAFEVQYPDGPTEDDQAESWTTGPVARRAAQQRDRAIRRATKHAAGRDDHGLPVVLADLGR